jgi:hypothetical protein
MTSGDRRVMRPWSRFDPRPGGPVRHQAAI